MGEGGEVSLKGLLPGTMVPKDMLAQLPQPEFDHITRLTARLLDMPMALIALVDERQKWLIARVGLDGFDPPRCPSFCDVAVANRAPLVVVDATLDPRFADNILVTDAPCIRFYAGVPLISSCGEAVGTLAVLDRRPRAALTAEQIATLEDLGRMVVDRMELQVRNHQARLQVEHDAVRQDLLRVVLEAADFDAACAQAMEYLRARTGALYCRLFRLALDGKAIRFVAGADGSPAGDERARELLRPFALTIHNSLVGHAIRSGDQVVTPDISCIDAAAYPAYAMLRQQGVVAVISTPFQVLDEHEAISLGFGAERADLDNIRHQASICAAAAETLRLLLRRLKDEAETRLFRRAVDASPDPVLISEAHPADEPGPRIMYCNDAFVALTGYTREYAVGRSPRFLQGPESSAEARANLRRAVQMWQPVRQMMLNYKADGTKFNIELNIAPVADRSGWITHWVSVQRDMTQQHQADQQRDAMLREMQALLEAMPGALHRYHRDAQGAWCRAYVSPSIEEVTGFTAEEVLRGGVLSERIAAAENAHGLLEMDKAVTSGSGFNEFRLLHRDGKLRLIQSRMRSYQDADGQVQLLCIWADVTRERGLATQLDQAAKLAELGELAAGLAHELNRPLANITLAAENALRALDRLPESRRRLEDKLTAISDIALRAANMVQHIQMFGRFDGGDVRPVTLESVLADTMILIQSKLMEFGVTVRADVPETLPAIMGRPIPLEQVMINLISNACDAYWQSRARIAPPDRIIDIRADAAEGRVTITVQDRAGGVPPDALPHLFEAFFTTKPPGEGTGLGLSISAGIVKDMGGKLSVSNEGGGAVFVIDLPAQAS